jgi:two-component system sensor histidine kinase MtrB
VPRQRLWDAGARMPRFAWRHWRRSIALRVVATTVLLSAVAVTGLGIVLSHQVGTGIVDAKRRAALDEFAAGVELAQSQLTHTDATDQTQLNELIAEIVRQLSGCQAGGFRVELLATGDADEAVDCGPPVSIVPSALRQVVVTKQAEASTYTRLPLALELPGATAGASAFIVGAPLTAPVGGSSYELYYVFPLNTEAATNALVNRTLDFGGLGLVLLFALVAGVVTRQVVTPVRMAARVASRLAAGRLEERMSVHGEDDLARLARAFNDMAHNLQRQIGQLEELSRVQRRFTADVSHELRTPLTTVRMAADLLYEGRASFAPEVARSAELLTTELDRFESLLTDLLEISRYDAGAAALDPTRVDIAALLHTEVAHVAALAAERGSVVTTVGVPAAGVYAEADARRVARIVRNLLSNAVEHGEGRPIEVTLAADEQVVGLRVRDHGIGLRPGESGLVFGRFWRGDPSRARRTGGTGLGLAIALEDARLHGGWLQAWGEPARGAAFRLVLPRRAGELVGGAPLPLAPADDPVDA